MYYHVITFSGDALSGLEPRKVEPLCRKNIVCLSYGSGPHVLAVTTSRLFAFARNLRELVE